MQTSFFCHRLPPPPPPPSFSGDRQSKRGFAKHHNFLTTMAFKKSGSDGKMVDENMIVLRERIRKVTAEMEGDDWLPENWMQWEKRYVSSGGYHSDILESVGLLQRFLMERRPSVVVGLVAISMVSSSTVTMAVLRWLITSVHGN